MMKCSNCDKTSDPISATKVAFGDGEPDVYHFYTSCSRCGREDNVDIATLEDSDKKRAIRDSQKSFWRPEGFSLWID